MTTPHIGTDDLSVRNLRHYYGTCSRCYQYHHPTIVQSSILDDEYSTPLCMRCLEEMLNFARQHQLSEDQSPMNFHGVRAHSPRRFPFFDVVAYHDNCTDGIAAAAVVATFFPDHPPVFVPLQYGKPLPMAILAGGKRILFVDFCPEEDQLEHVRMAWDDFFVIDHHKSRDWTAKPEWWNHVFYSEERCGSVLTWLWLHAERDVQISKNPLLLYVQDRDLWQWLLPQSREVSAALAEEPKTVERFSQLIREDPRQFIAPGRTLLKSRTRAAQLLASKAFRFEQPDGPVFRVVNATADLSEVGEEILLLWPEIDVACCFFVPTPTEVVLSFRSRPVDSRDWSALRVAKLYGGGGHEHAAGTRLDSETWNTLLKAWASVL